MIEMGKESEKKKYFVVRERAVPEVLLKVVEAKKLLDSGRVQTVQDAAEQTGISRSSFYKYKDDIFPFHEQARGKTITFIIQMDDEPGLLSGVLQTIARFHGNILTIHQSIPINGVATLTLSVDILPGDGDAEAMVEYIEAERGNPLPEDPWQRIETTLEENMVNIAVLGYGTVGSGVVEVINTNHKSINKRAGAEINIKYVLDLRDFPGDPVQDILVHDYEIIASDPEVDIVVEVMGGIEPAYTFVKRALESGKSVCTSNKALVAKHGPELMEIARERDINFLFEASCGGGIPIIRALNSSLTADEIDEITGILNGTTNYMLYKMSTEGSDFDAVLKEAQEKGYAEADPTADVEGYDACRKIAILSSLAYGKFLNYENIYTEGITKITPVDMAYCR